MHIYRAIEKSLFHVVKLNEKLCQNTYIKVCLFRPRPIIKPRPAISHIFISTTTPKKDMQKYKQTTSLDLRSSDGKCIGNGKMPSSPIKKFMVRSFFRAIDSPLMRRMGLRGITVKQKLTIYEVSVSPPKTEEGQQSAASEKEWAARQIRGRLGVSGFIKCAAGLVLGAIPAIWAVLNYEAAQAALHQGHNAVKSLAIGAGIAVASSLLGLLLHQPARIGKRIFYKAIGFEEPKKDE